MVNRLVNLPSRRRFIALLAQSLYSSKEPTTAAVPFRR
jgi:hypothetical protein